MIFLYF